MSAISFIYSRVVCVFQNKSNSPGFDVVDNDVFAPDPNAKPTPGEPNNNSHAHLPRTPAGAPSPSNRPAQAPVDDSVAPAAAVPSFAMAPAGTSSVRAPEEKPVAYCPPDLDDFDYADETLIRKDKKRAKGQSKGQGRSRDDVERGFVS